MKRLSLRQRVGLAFGLFGLLFCIGFAALTERWSEGYEHVLISAILEREVAEYRARLARDPDTPLPDTRRLRWWWRDQAPAALATLPPGVHDGERFGMDDLHVARFALADGREALLVTDVGEIESLEALLFRTLVGIVLGGGLLSAWLGWWWAGRAIAPVGRLAAAVDSLPDRPIATHLAEGLGQDELARLAQAMDRYQQRLVEADAAEKRFLADASHELRTPIAVVRGAVEVLMDDALPEPQQRRLARVDRGVAELSFLIEALLLAARGAPAPGDGLSLRDACRRALDEAAPLLQERRMAVDLDPAGGDGPSAPGRWLEAILRNALLRMAAAREAGTLRLRVDGEGVWIGGTAPVADGPAVSRSDHGLGLRLVARLSADIGWSLREGRDEDGLPWLRLGPGAGP